MMHNTMHNDSEQGRGKSRAELIEGGWMDNERKWQLIESMQTSTTKENQSETTFSVEWLNADWIGKTESISELAEMIGIID